MTAPAPYILPEPTDNHSSQKTLAAPRGGGLGGGGRGVRGGI
jgi:hypothetical protein